MYNRLIIIVSLSVIPMVAMNQNTEKKVTEAQRNPSDDLEALAIVAQYLEDRPDMLALFTAGAQEQPQIITAPLGQQNKASMFQCLTDMLCGCCMGKPASEQHYVSMHPLSEHAMIIDEIERQPDKFSRDTQYLPMQ
jgi:hypothetical protein